ncbi:MAG: hypothetical protein BJ554DRAFT_8244, partial [Olpidium bornovanus]
KKKKKKKDVATPGSLSEKKREKSRSRRIKKNPRRARARINSPRLPRCDLLRPGSPSAMVAKTQEQADEVFDEVPDNEAGGRKAPQGQEGGEEEPEEKEGEEGPRDSCKLAVQRGAPATIGGAEERGGRNESQRARRAGKAGRESQTAKGASAAGLARPPEIGASTESPIVGRITRYGSASETS